MTGFKVRDISELVWTTWPNRPDGTASFCVECQHMLLFTCFEPPVEITCFHCHTEYYKLEPGIYG